MTTTDSGLTGLHAFSSDGAKLGKVKRVFEAGGRRYVEVGGFLARDLIVPADTARRISDERVELGYKNIYLDRAPEHRSKGEPTQEELARIDDFYRRAA